MNTYFALIESQPLVVALLKLIKSCYSSSVNDNDGCLPRDESYVICVRFKSLYSTGRALWKESNLNLEISFSIKYISRLVLSSITSAIPTATAVAASWGRRLCSAPTIMSFTLSSSLRARWQCVSGTCCRMCCCE